MSARRKHAPRRGALDVDRLIAGDEGLTQHDAMWRRLGYQCAGGKAWRRRDGTYTVRIVWRKRQPDEVSTVTYSVQGFVPA